MLDGMYKFVSARQHDLGSTTTGIVIRSLHPSEVIGIPGIAHFPRQVQHRNSFCKNVHALGKFR